MSFWLLLLAAVAVSPWMLVSSILLGAVVHELGHLLMLSSFHVPIEKIKLSAFGAEIFASGAERLPYGKELLVTLAGPLVNALFAALFALSARLFVWPEGYVFAGANAILCIYNLLPIPPLDGGRALYLIIAYFFGPLVGDAAAAVVGTAFAFLLLLFGAYFSLISHSGMFFLLASFSLFVGVLPQLSLAKNAVKV